MTDSFQNEIPKSRINLSVDLRVDGKTKTVALPHKTLVMGDFSAGANDTPLQDRERKSVTKESLDSVLKDVSPSLHLVLTNKMGRGPDELPVSLTFESLKDFHPEALVMQIPPLKRLLALRNLLKDLRAHVIDNHSFKERLKEMFESPDSIRRLQQDIDAVIQESSNKEEV